MENAKLNAALSKAQGQIQHATKSQKNEAFKRDGKASKYADIADVIEVIQGPAASNGLSVTFDFKTDFSIDAKPLHYIRYVVRHESGEREESQWLLMLMRDQTQHGFGASNTYYRRQLLKAIYQIPEDDDDGNTQSLNQAPKPHSHRPPNLAPKNELDAALSKPRAHLEELYAFVEINSLPPEQVKGAIQAVCGSLKKSSMLNEGEVAQVIAFLNDELKGLGV